jgi:amino acid transporter
MATTASAAPPSADQSPGGGKGLRSGALGLLSSVVIALASTAPAYSLAAAVGLVSQEVGTKAPLIMILAFVPILFVSYAYKALNSRIPDCGTNFTWAARAFGPRTGWMSGWGAIIAQVIVLANLAQIAGIYTFLLVGAEDLAGNALAVAGVGSVWLVLMTFVAYRGIELSARLQMALLSIELVVLLAFGIAAVVQVYSGGAPEGSQAPSLAWFNPFDGELDAGGLSAGVLIGLFAYWGWDTAVSTNEETRDSAVTPGRSAVLSTLLLLVTYVLVTTATQAYAGVGETGIGLANPDHSDDALSPVADAVLGSAWGKFLVLAVLSSAAASAQTTILPAARSTLAMAVNKALPARFAHVHPRFRTPSFATWTMGTVAVVFFFTLSVVQGGRILGDVILCLGFMIAFYYGITGLASFWLFRRELRRSAKDALLKGVLPLLGGLILTWAFVRSAIDLVDPAESETSLLGIGGAFFLAVGSLLLGVVLMVAWNLARPAYFRGETVPGSDVEVRSS